MSRGLGRIERACLKVVQAAEHGVFSIDVAGAVFETRLVSETQDVTIRRALRSLAKKNLIVCMSKTWRRGQHRWYTPEKCRATLAKVAALKTRMAVEREGIVMSAYDALSETEQAIVRKELGIAP